MRLKRFLVVMEFKNNMSNKVRRSIIYWIGVLIQLIACFNIYDVVPDYSWYLIMNLMLIYISGGIIFMTSVGKNRPIQKFFGHDLKKECECPSTKSSSLPNIKREKDIS